MAFSINFGGPGWIWGGEWVPIEDQSQVMLASAVEVDGPRVFSGALPEQAVINPNDVPRSMPVIADEDRLLKVVAARLENGRLRADSLTDLSSFARERSLEWKVPEGRWRIMAFWLTRRICLWCSMPMRCRLRPSVSRGGRTVRCVGPASGSWPTARRSPKRR